MNAKLVAGAEVAIYRPSTSPFSMLRNKLSFGWKVTAITPSGQFTAFHPTLGEIKFSKDGVERKRTALSYDRRIAKFNVEELRRECELETGKSQMADLLRRMGSDANANWSLEGLEAEAAKLQNVLDTFRAKAAAVKAL